MRIPFCQEDMLKKIQAAWAKNALAKIEKLRAKNKELVVENKKLKAQVRHQIARRLSSTCSHILVLSVCTQVELVKTIVKADRMAGRDRNQRKHKGYISPVPEHRLGYKQLGVLIEALLIDGVPLTKVPYITDNAIRKLKVIGVSTFNELLGIFICSKVADDTPARHLDRFWHVLQIAGINSGRNVIIHTLQDVANNAVHNF